MKEILARNEEEFAEEIICKAYGKISGTASVSFFLIKGVRIWMVYLSKIVNGIMFVLVWLRLRSHR